MAFPLVRVRRWLALGLAILLLLVVLLVVLLSSSTVSRFVLQQVESAVPELRFRDVSGSLAGRLHFQLEYRSPELQVYWREGRLDLGWSCLLRGAVCVERLAGEALQIQLAESEAGAEDGGARAPGPPELPALAAPVALELQSLTLDRLQVTREGNDLYHAGALEAAVTWRDDRLHLPQLSLVDDWCRWALAGTVTLSGDYPLDQALSCQLRQDGSEGRAELALNGDLRQLSAKLEARVEAPPLAEPAAVTVSANLAPLDEQLPFDLELRTEDFAVQTTAETVHVQSLSLAGEGSLLNTRITGEADFRHSLWEGSHRLRLEGQADTEHLQVESLQLSLPQGAVEAEGSLAYADALEWNGAVSWREIALQQFHEELQGQLTGAVDTRVNLAGEQPRARADIRQFTGRWRERALTAQGTLQWAENTLTADNFQVQQADNSVRLDGQWTLGGQLELLADLALADLTSLPPPGLVAGLDGRLSGRVEVEGPAADPRLRAELSGAGLRLGERSLGALALDLDWPGRAGPGGTLELTLDELRATADLNLNAVLRARGDLSAHRAQLSVAGLESMADNSLSLACTGGTTSETLDQWRGECEQLEMDVALNGLAQQWELAQPVALQWQRDPARLQLDAFCLAARAARLCSAEPVVYQSDSLSPVRVRGRQLPVAWLEPWLPEGASLTGQWAFQVEGADLLGSPQLNASLSSDPLTVDWPGENGRSTALRITGLHADWDFRDDRHRLEWRLPTQDSGELEGDLRLEEQRVAGRLAISQLRLASFAPLVMPAPDDRLEGVVNADLDLEGPVAKPRARGLLQVQEGLVNTVALPLPLQAIEAEFRVRDYSAELDGRFRAAQSDGEIAGQMHWEDADWQAQLALRSEPVPVEPEPGIRLEVAPDLEFRLSPGMVALNGQVNLPRAQIEISELPEQAVGVSGDEVVVGEESAEEGLALRSDIEVVLGDAVSFEGFGLETRIVGNLRLQQSGGERLDAQGVLRLREGRYTAYGQNLRIRDGDLIFVGDLDNPQLRLEAVRADLAEAEEDTEVGLRASGPARQPNIELFSQPDMPQQAQLSYLLTGNPPGADVERDPQLAAAEAALSYALESDLGSGIARRAGSALGIEDLQISAGNTEEGTQIGLTGHITPRLLLRYGVGVFDAINTVTLRYQLASSLYLEASSGEGSDLGLLWSFERD